MVDRGEQGGVCPADPLGRRGRRAQHGKLRFQRGELAHQPVVLGVTDRRLVQHVVAVLGVVNLLGQLGGALPRFGRSGAQLGDRAAPGRHLRRHRFLLLACRFGRGCPVRSAARRGARPRRLRCGRRVRTARRGGARSRRLRSGRPLGRCRSPVRRGGDRSGRLRCGCPVRSPRPRHGRSTSLPMLAASALDCTVAGTCDERAPPIGTALVIGGELGGRRNRMTIGGRSPVCERAGALPATAHCRDGVVRGRAGQPAARRHHDHLAEPVRG